MDNNKKIQSICAGTITFRINENNKIEFLLVMHNKGNNFGIPKGHCEQNESVEEAAVRETYEETGIVVRLLSELSPVMVTTKKEDKIVYCFMAKQLNEGAKPKPQNKNEIKKAKWFSIQELPNVHKYQLPLLTSAIKAIKRNLK